MLDDAPRSDWSPLDVARQAELLELTQDAVLVRDLRTSAVSYWNRGAERLYGWSRQEAAGQVTHTLLHTRFPVPLTTVNEALVSAGYWEGELVHTRKNGDQVVVSSRQAVQRDQLGQPVAILEINTDITQRKHAEQEQVRLASEQRARQLAERALDRLSRLQRVTAGLSEALTPRQVAAVVVDQGIAALDAQAGRIALVQSDSGGLDVIGFSGYSRVTTHFSSDEPLPTNEVVRTGQPLFVPTYAEVKARFPRFAEFAEPQVEGALAVVPLVVEGRVVGAMTLAFAGDRGFDQDDHALLIALATQCAQALERARLYDLSLSVQEDLRHSRDQLAAILGGIAEGVTVQDANGALIFANEVAAKLSGFSSADEFKQSFSSVVQRFSLFDEGGNPFPYDRLPGRRVLNGETPEEVVVQFRHPESGEWRWSILDAAPVRDEQGTVRMVVNIFRDITDRKRHTDATDFLAAASTILGSTLDMESRLENLAELVVARIADWCILDLVDPDDTVRRAAVAHANPDDAELAQAIRDQRPDATREAMQPRSWIVLPLLARGLTLGSITLATVGSGRRYDQIDFEIAQDLATRAALAIDSAHLFHEAQEQAEHHAVLNAALRETVEERDRALADLHQALRTRDEFLASASHDLKNPLASIKATAQLLERRLNRGIVDVDRLREGLHRLDAIASRASGLVDELLDLASMQMGRPLDLDRHSEDLVKLAREVVEEQQLATERHTIRVVEAPEAQLIGMWDGRRLGRVLANLLDNAVKYSPDGGPIDVRLHRDGDWAAIDVIDHGIGIPDGDQRRIFERFQRASNVEQRIGGTGIGLASAWHILDSHGGTISVQSQEGSGTTFFVRLPIALE
jgi:PAS domain S-box-containing protein